MASRFWRNGDRVDARAALAVAAALLPLVGCSGSPYDATGESSDEVRVCPATTTVEGIDVSYYQKTINWQQVKASGVAFAVTRISDGLNFPDSEFANNWAGIRAAGLIRGAYQYFEPGQDALAQADMVVQRVGMLGAGDLPVQLDMEATGGQSSATIATKMKTWMDRVTTGTGKRPFVYTAKYFWNDNVASRDFSTDKLWVANYGVTCPDLPDAWSNWSIWQYSSTGAVPGIAGNVDLDKFNGSLEDLKRISGTGAPYYAAEYVSQSFPLASAGMTMPGNAKVPAYIELRNIGTKAWDSSTRLATSNPRDRPSMFAASDWLDPTRLAAVQGTVPPGATYRFQFTLQAPAAPGVYAEYFNVVEDGVAWFSDPGQGGPPDNQLQNRITVTGGAPTDASADGAGRADGAGGDATPVRPDADAGGGNTLDAPGSEAGGGTTPDATVSRDAGDPSSDASTRDAGGSGLSPPSEDDAGCGCRLAGQRSDRGARALGWVAAACVLARRRRRRAPVLTRAS